MKRMWMVGIVCGVLAVVLVGRVVGDGAVAGGGAAAAGGVKRDSFDSAGVKISYIEAGEGEVVILIHGLYASAETNWKMPGTFDLLAKNHRVVALDMRGHGQSDKPAGEDAYGEPMVEDVLRLMDHLKIEKAHIVGYSMGGMVAMKFVVEHPERVITATLGGMGWLKKGSAEAAIFERMKGREGGGGGAGQTPVAAVHGMAKLGVTEEEVKGVKVPVHILVGSNDNICKKLYVEPAKRVRPEWEVTEIAGVGHIACVMSAEFKESVGKWIDARKGAGGAAGAATQKGK